jgi:hypothetical protein
MTSASSAPAASNPLPPNSLATPKAKWWKCATVLLARPDQAHSFAMIVPRDNYEMRQRHGGLNADFLNLKWILVNGGDVRWENAWFPYANDDGKNC